MNENTAEFVYRMSFGLLWLVYFVIRFYFQGKVKKAGRSYEHINEKQELVYFRLFALAFLLLALYFLTPWIDFAHLGLAGGLRWLGGGITLAGIVFFAWCHQALGVNWTAVLALSDQQELVTSGPYKAIRHPMYTAFFLIGIGFFLLSANFLVALIYLTPLTVMYFARVNPEEQMMLERFGETYREYMQHSGRLLPKLRKS